MEDNISKYKKKPLFQKDTGTPKFIAALFTLTKIQKQAKCISINERIKNMWYMYSGILPSHLKKDILPFATIQMNLKGITLSEISQRKKTICYHFYMESKK